MIAAQKPHLLLISQTHNAVRHFIREKSSNLVPDIKRREEKKIRTLEIIDRPVNDSLFLKNKFEYSHDTLLDTAAFAINKCYKG